MQRGGRRCNGKETRRVGSQQTANADKQEKQRIGAAPKKTNLAPLAPFAPAGQGGPCGPVFPGIPWSPFAPSRPDILGVPGMSCTSYRGMLTSLKKEA